MCQRSVALTFGKVMFGLFGPGVCEAGRIIVFVPDPDVCLRPAGFFLARHYAWVFWCWFNVLSV